jgi:hypothetical protein
MGGGAVGRGVVAGVGSLGWVGGGPAGGAAAGGGTAGWLAVGASASPGMEG